MELIFVRHTRVDVPPGTCYGQTDVPLADSFEQEAAETCSRLLALGPFDAVFSSPLTRARRLAAYCGFTHPVLDHRLQEMNMGCWEMQRYDDIDDPNLQRWYDDYLHVVPTGGESFMQLAARVSAFLDEICQRSYQRVAVFAHGGVLLSAGIHAHLYTAENALQHLPPFGGIVQMQIASGFQGSAFSESDE